MSCNRLAGWALSMPCATGVPSNDSRYPILTASAAAAIAFVDDMTCNQYGLCSDTAYPTTQSLCYPYTLDPQQLQSWLWSHNNFWRFDSTVRLDLLPFFGRVDSITSVNVNGTALPTTDYALASHRYLMPMRPGGLWPWPYQQPNLVPGSVGTWSVTVVRGSAPPANVLAAASDLACQLFSLGTGVDCDVPANAASVTRDGVTISLRTGILQNIPSISLLSASYDCMKFPANRANRGRKVFDPSRHHPGVVYTP